MSFQLILSVAASIAATFFFSPTFVSLAQRWREPYSSYDHAILVPFICLWMTYREFKKSAETPISIPVSTKVFIFGLLGLASSLLLSVVSSVQQINFLQASALVFCIWSCVLILGGTSIWSRFRWPLGFLLMLIPVPTFFLAQMTFGLRQTSTLLVAGTLQILSAVFKFPFERVGNELYFAHHQVTIVDACSGLNTLFSVITMGLILVYLEDLPIKRWIIAALLIPSAVIANVIRILSICAFVALGYSDFAFGAGHDAFGILAVILALALLAFGLPGFRSRGSARSDLNTSKQMLSETGSPKSIPRVQRLFAVFLLFSLAFPAGLALQHPIAVTPPLTPTQPPGISSSPDSLWKFREFKMDAAVVEVLGVPDARMFEAVPIEPKKLPLYYYWIHAADSRKIGHPPELCYRGDDYEILDRKPLELLLGNQTLPVMQLLVEREKKRLLVLYWYRIGDQNTSNYLTHQWHWVWSQITRIARSTPPEEGSLYRISTELDPSLPEEKRIEDATTRMSAFIQTILK